MFDAVFLCAAVSCCYLLPARLHRCDGSRTMLFLFNSRLLYDEMEQMRLRSKATNVCEVCVWKVKWSGSRFHGKKRRAFVPSPGSRFSEREGVVSVRGA